MGRAPCCDKANVKKGPWSPEEDAKLKAYIEKYGTGGNWIALPQKIGLKRCGKSCRLRWLNYLRPNIKHGGFTEEEDNIICSLYISIGSRWSIIAAQLPGRTDNDIKNYWNTRLKKKLLGRRNKSSSSSCSFSYNPMMKDRKGNEIMEDSSSNNINALPLSTSALERLQLHMQLQLQNNPFSFYNNININNPFHHQKHHEFYKPAVPHDDQKLDLIVPLGNDSVDSANPAPGEGVHDDQDQSRIMGDHHHHHDHHVSDDLHDMILSSSSSDRTMLYSNNMTQGYDDQIQDRMADFDCFGEINTAKDSLDMMWWTNDLEAKSASSNSWASTTTTTTTTITTPPVLQPESMFQHDYELGYSL